MTDLKVCNRKSKRPLSLVVCVLLVLILPVHAAKKRFTVTDEIRSSSFPAPWEQRPDVIYSPDGKYFTIETERGLLEQNRPESTIRIYRVNDVRSFLIQRERAPTPPAPAWAISKATYKNRPIITDLQWLADSSGIAFLLATESGTFRLCVADIETRKISELTPADVDVKEFAIHDRNDYVYVSPSPTIEKTIRAKGELGTDAVATGIDLMTLLSPVVDRTGYDLGELWVIIDGRNFRVEDSASGEPIPFRYGGREHLSLAPNGTSLVTALEVRHIPKDWEALYPPPLSSSHYRIKSGSQDVTAVFSSSGYVSEYVLIDLPTGHATPLTYAPTGVAAGWTDHVNERADWSGDGSEVVLNNSFIRQSDTNAEPLQRPCVVVVHLENRKMDCVEPVKGPTKLENGYGREEGFHYIQRAYFPPGLKNEVVIEYLQLDASEGSTTYRYSPNGQWSVSKTTNKWADINSLIETHVEESFTEPPVLVATDKATGNSGIILDPNPEFKDIDLGQASIYRWRDKDGREWTGGLYKPPDFVPGRTYPLVVQTHGFWPSLFAPSGLYKTGYAARELAGAGILVLQVPDCQVTADPAEIECAVAGYESAIGKLVADGLADRKRVGIMGFSRTCLYVTQMLTTSTIPISAASINDGMMSSYWVYLASIDIDAENAYARQQEGVMGAAPIGVDLRKWVERAAGFNFYKINTPLQLVAIGPTSVLEMWEPYAIFRYLHKPVDLIWLREGEHELSNPAMRVVSQGGSLDWFRFWLKGEEDPDPAKAGQYRRWRDLRKLQTAKDGKNTDSM